MKTGISIGAEEKGVLAARQTIMAILNHSRPDEVILEALKSFTRICNVDNATISNCFIGDNPPTAKKKRR